jgi:hypothetical protein
MLSHFARRPKPHLAEAASQGPFVPDFDASSGGEICRQAEPRAALIPTLQSGIARMQWSRAG